MRRYAPEGAGRYDRLHGDEPEIEARREEERRMKDEDAAEHWDGKEDER